MSILETIFNKYFGPVLVKEGSDAEGFIEKMRSLSAKSSGKLKDKIDNQIVAADAGLYGERQVAYELKNSGMDMLIAHDVNIEKNGLSAQIDYLVVTRKHVFVIECKNLYGNIEIDDKGNFIRHMGQGKFYRKEGFVSPVSQNARHLNVLKEIRREYKKNLLAQTLFDKAFPQIYRSIVVLANPKTVLNDKAAPQSVRDVVIRLDQLVAHMKKYEAADDNYNSSETEMHELMDCFLKHQKDEKSDYAKKYEELLAAQRAEEPTGDEKYMPPELREPKKVVESTPAPEKVVQEKTAPAAEDSKKEENSVSAAEDSGKICPKCGKPLVLRTAKKGENAGQQFWGCSGFPKCWYREEK